MPDLNYLDSQYDQQGNLIKKPNIPSPIVNAPQQMTPTMPAPINNLQAGPYEQKQGQLAMSYPDMNSPEYHIGKLHGILNMIGGAIGGIGGHPEVGKELALGRINRARDNADRQIKALDEPVRSEISRRAADIQTAKLGEKTDLDKQREDRLNRTEADNVTLRKTSEDDKKALNDSNIRIKEINSQLAEQKISIDEWKAKVDAEHKINTELQNKINEEGKDIRAGKHEAASTERTNIIANNKQNLNPTEKLAADNAIKQINNTEDPRIKDSIMKNLTPKVRTQVESDPNVESYMKLGENEKRSLTGSTNTLKVLKDINSEVKVLEDKIGPLSGRSGKLKDLIGSNSTEMSKLIADLRNLELNEASIFGSRGVTTPLLRTLESGGIADVSQAIKEFKGKMAATEAQARRNYETITGKQYPKTSNPLEGVTIKVVKP